MARQCHLDTCPTGIATQRDDLRAKFAGTPEMVERFFGAVAEDVRRELAQIGARSLGEVIGQGAHLAVAPGGRPTLALGRLLRAPAWPAEPGRRAEPGASRSFVTRQPASALEARLAAELVHLPQVVTEQLTHIDRPDPAPASVPTAIAGRLTTADRSFGAHTSGLMARGIVRRPVSWHLEGVAGQSFGAFAGPGIELTLEGQANDYVGKGLSGGRLVLRPEACLEERAAELAICGNTCLYGATAGRLHVVGRAGMRFAIRNSGAVAVVEGVGTHGCEYMTGGVVVVLGPAGRNLGAGMTGGRLYLHDPDGSGRAALDAGSVTAMRLAEAIAERPDGIALADELRSLLIDHRDAGSRRARALLADPMALTVSTWLIEAIGAPAAAGVDPVAMDAVRTDGRSALPGRA
jgi:glutamate synthase domain-containing protein 3